MNAVHATFTLLRFVAKEFRYASAMHAIEGLRCVDDGNSGIRDLLPNCTRSFQLVGVTAWCYM